MASTALEGSDLLQPRRVRRALLVADMVESVRLLDQFEADVIARWRLLLAQIRSEVLPICSGRMVKSLGDGMLLEFDAVLNAVEAAFAIQRRIPTFNVDRIEAAAIRLRIGVHVADVVVDPDDLFGAGVNLAARLASLAPPDGIVVSSDVRDEMVPGVHGEVEDLGECFVKNLSLPVRAFAIRPPGGLRAVVRERPASESVEPLLPRIAVIPLRCTSEDPADRAVGDALADDIIAALSGCSGAQVLSRLSTAALRAQGDDCLAQCRDRLKASYVLSGTHVVSAGAVRLRLELSATADDSVVWAGAFRLRTEALFLGDDETLADIAAQVGQAISARELRRIRALPVANLAGYTLYLGGQSLLHRLSRSEFDKARDILDYLAMREPRCAGPHAQLAKWHIFQMVQGWSADRIRDGSAARDAARHALERDPDDSLSLAFEGLTHAIVETRLDDAEACYRRAVALNPQEPYAWAFLSGLHSYRDRGAEAVEAADRAVELSPLDPARFLFDAYRASARLLTGEYTRAVELAHDSLRANALHTPSHRLLIIALALAGRLDEARAAAQVHGRLEPRFSIRNYRDRYPGREARHVEQYALALREAGVPE